MKNIFVTYLIIFSHSCFAQDTLHGIHESVGIESMTLEDSSCVNYYIVNFKDTVWFSSNSNVIKCDYMKKIDRSHNQCTYYTFNEPMSGFFTIVTLKDNMKEVYKGTLTNGKYNTGTIIRLYPNGSIQMTGQFRNNFKIGFWTTYLSNGSLYAIFKFIEGADEPVVEIEYGGNGSILNTIDEEDEILKKMNGH